MCTEQIAGERAPPTPLRQILSSSRPYNIIFRRIIRTYLRDCPGENGACSRICTGGDLLLLAAQRRFKPGRWLRRRGEYHLRGGIALSRIIIYYICVCSSYRSLPFNTRFITRSEICIRRYDRKMDIRSSGSRRVRFAHGFPIINHLTF